MDPLSVTASIVGILAAAYKIGELLNGTISTAKDAPQVLTALASEIREVQAVLPSLQVLLINLSTARPYRSAMIQLDQLIVTLTEAALTLAELEKAVAPFIIQPGVKIPIRVKLRWTRAESNCTKIVERLQRHKASMSLMLNILQCTSDAEAVRSQSSLELMVEQLLQSNQQLCRRLQNLEDSFDARSIISDRSDNLSLASEADNVTITTARSAANKRTSILEAVKVRFTFDDDLQSSRVYNRVKSDACGHSSLSSAVRTQTWSIFSGLSLADISVISVIALPLYPEDVKTHAEYYSFGDPEPTSVETTATWTNNQHLVDTHVASKPPIALLSTSNQDQWPLSDRDENTPTETHLPPWPATSSLIDDGLGWSPEAGLVLDQWPLFDGDVDTTHSESSDAYSSNAENPSSASSVQSEPSSQVHVDTLRNLESRFSASHLDTATGDNSSTPQSLVGNSDEEEDDVVYPCKGCGEILEEGKAFELAGNRWHIDCFRCNTCGTLLDSDANLLLLADGSLICKNCTYDCEACGNMIEDLAILTGDKAYCEGCFRCRNCKRKIENLRYARTSQGIFCMSCHESLLARKRKKERERNGANSQLNTQLSKRPDEKSLPPLPPAQG